MEEIKIIDGKFKGTKPYQGKSWRVESKSILCGHFGFIQGEPATSFKKYNFYHPCLLENKQNFLNDFKDLQPKILLNINSDGIMSNYVSGVWPIEIMEIFSASRNEPALKGIEIIYFLLKGNKVIYVGQSINFISRLKDHKRNIDFDSFFLTDNLGGGTINEAEKFWIKTLQPKNNNRCLI